jgi:lipopolysaccharide transport system permease protein
VVTLRIEPQRIDLVLTLVRRQLVLRYRRSVLGIAWSQLAPLALLGVLAFVFSVVVPLRIPHYALFVIVGLLPWSWFASGISAATESVVEGRDLVRLPGFPTTLLPVVAVTTHLVHFLLALPALVAVVLIVLHQLPLTLAALPLVLVVQFLVMVAPSYLLAAMNVRHRDVSHLVAVALLPLFYASPVFYRVEQVPSRYHWLYDVNPLAQLIVAYRDVLLFGRWPAWGGLAAVAAAATVFALLCRRQFERLAPSFPELL